jgi:hypothetical protein
MEERRRSESQRLFDDAAAARRFQRRLRDVRPPAYARPALQYDESGYPIERSASLATRVRRLITG